MWLFSVCLRLQWKTYIKIFNQFWDPDLPWQSVLWFKGRILLFNFGDHFSLKYLLVIAQLGKVTVQPFKIKNYFLKFRYVRVTLLHTGLKILPLEINYL